MTETFAGRGELDHLSSIVDTSSRRRKGADVLKGLERGTAEGMFSRKDLAAKWSAGAWGVQVTDVKRVAGRRVPFATGELGALVGWEESGVADAAGVEAGAFEVTEVFEHGVELVLEGGAVAAEEVGSMREAGGALPCFSEKADFADLFPAEVDAEGDFEEGGFHHHEALEAPVDNGEFFDEADLGFDHRRRSSIQAS